MSDESPLAKPQGYEPCEECGAPLDPQQRYCVECAARRGNGSNPSSRYFAAMSKKSRRPLTRAQAERLGRRQPRRRGRLLRAAADRGRARGRGRAQRAPATRTKTALLKALHQAESSRSRRRRSRRGTATGRPPRRQKSQSRGERRQKRRQRPREEIESGEETPRTKAARDATKTQERDASTRSTGYKAAEGSVEEDTKLVEENPEQTGENYIKAQQNLPEVMVVGGEEEGRRGSELPPGVEP